MAKLTQPETVERNLRQAYDDSYYQGIRRRVRFALGASLRSPGPAMAVSLSGDVPDDVDMLPEQGEPGQSRRILTNSSLMAAKVTHVQPDPDFPDKQRWKEAVSKAFFRALWNGRPHMGPTKFEEYGEWQPECQRAFMDFDALGTGFVQIGVRDGWTCIQHHPLSRVIWDRHRIGISRARYITFVHLLSEEEAVAQFGSSILKEAQFRDSGRHSLRTIKAIQYFDMGLGSRDPTEMWRLNTFNGKVLSVDPNEYECLPFAYGEFMHFWGMRRAMGRIDFQMADQELRNALERYQRLVLERGPGFDAVDTGKMDPDDQDAFESGELLAALRFDVPPMGKIGDYVQRFSPHNPPEGVFRLMEYLDRMDPGNSGISDGDRANITSSPRTLGEIENAQQGADTQKNWSQRQYARFLERLIYKANYISAKLHTAPTPVSVDGAPFLLNEPGVPQSNLEYWLTPHSWPSVNEDALTKNSPLRRMQVAQGKWTQHLQDPLLNPVEVRRRMFREMGEKDVEALFNPQALALAQGDQGGMSLTGALQAASQPPVEQQPPV